MKRVVVAALAMASLGSGAGAADLRMPVKAPAAVAAAPFSWSGCYIGGYVGGAFGEAVRFTDRGNALFPSYSGGVGAARIVPAHSWNADLGNSFIGGGTLGCNWQFPGSPFVIGLEGEGGYMRLRGDALDPRTVQGTPQGTRDVLGSARVGDWYAMATGRVGYALDRVLFYAKGGAAFLPVRTSVTDTCLVVAQGCGNWIISAPVDHRVTTWTVGGGIEWAFASNWSVKGEYMFIGLDRTTAGCGTSFNPNPPPNNVTPGGPFCFDRNFNGIHTAKLGINYRFGPF